MLRLCWVPLPCARLTGILLSALSVLGGGVALPPVVGCGAESKSVHHPEVAGCGLDPPGDFILFCGRLISEGVRATLDENAPREADQRGSKH